ncbi:MAG: formate dehydrogenase accessory sulfurtransferase FdhD [Flavobacterium sp.]|nr:MAG: formate dehydrogenase accessory sulfurtransferase FdhD [Flavobacterium sp.]
MESVQGPHIKSHLVTKFLIGDEYLKDDSLAVEEPFEIKLSYFKDGKKVIKNISVTMRTPGNDEELAKGFLYTEGIIKSTQVLERVENFVCGEGKENSITLFLASGDDPNLQDADRNFYMTSSCGVCGKSSVGAIRTISEYLPDEIFSTVIDRETLLGLPDKLWDHQDVFKSTGGLHACGLFDFNGQLIMLREDVGRHNALDKLIGRALLEGMLPLKNYVLLLSGRASFELIQKAAMAGITIVAAIGAPSSLAVELAAEFNITLIGFLRGNGFNTYTGAGRIK